MPGANHQRDALAPPGFPLVTRPRMDLECNRNIGCASQKLAAPARNWLRQPLVTTTDLRHSVPKAGEAMARATALPVQHPTDRLVGQTPAIQALQAQIRHLAT